MKNHPDAPIAPRLPEGDPLDPGALVPANGGPVELEIGPGRGGFLFERLAADTTVRIIGLEIRLKWATLVDQRLRERGFGGRARVFAEDARDAIRRFSERSLAVVFLHFPDPWWKKRHKKRLVLGDPLVAEIARVLRPGGRVFIQTDVEERAELYEGLFRGRPEFTYSGSSPRLTDNPYGARSPRERRALLDGLPIHRLGYERR
jgi:tRNA (guanine-N7-)-methyltransferase